MWWLLFYPDIFTPLAYFWQTVANLDIGIHIWRFLLLGLIPGTTYELSFLQISTALWMIAFCLFIKYMPKMISNRLPSFRLVKQS